MSQAPAPEAESSVPNAKTVLSNSRVTVGRLDMAPGAVTPMHKHERDSVSVIINAGRLENVESGIEPQTDRFSGGEVLFRSAGYAHSTRNTGSAPLRIAIVDFAEPQGKIEKSTTRATRSCNPAGTKCVQEKYLFCTAKVCVEDVTMAPGAISTKHSHTTDHMLIAISPYEISDDVEGKGKVMRTRKSGEVEYIPAGIEHQLTNVGKAPAHFTVILWR